MTPPRVEPPKGLRRHWVNIECALEAAQSCLRNETPETMPPEAAREWTLFSIREALLTALPAVRAVAPCLTPAEIAALTAERDAAVAQAEALADAVQRTFNACCDEDAADIDADSLRAALTAFRAANPETPR